MRKKDKRLSYQNNRFKKLIKKIKRILKLLSEIIMMKRKNYKNKLINWKKKFCLKRTKSKILKTQKINFVNFKSCGRIKY